jgi:hypothetical protein
MDRFNWRRVALAGAAAGLIFNVGGMSLAALIGLPETFARFGVQPTPGTALLHVSLRFGLGFALVVAYAGARIGLGPGLATAMKAGLVIWFVGYVPGSAVLHELGVLTRPQLLLALSWGLGEVLLAAAVGGWLYRDARS